MDYYDDYTGDGAIMMDDYGDDYAPADAAYPAYLRDVPAGRRTYGTLSYNRRSKCWTIKGDSCVTELAKRLFPGCDGRGRGVARFTAHRRIIGDLNWLMLRYPLEIKETDRERWERALEEAREYAVERQRQLRESLQSNVSELRSELQAERQKVAAQLAEFYRHMDRFY